MRILQIAQKPQRRGAEVFAFQLSTELRRRGHEVQIVYLYPHHNSKSLPLRATDCVLAGQEAHPAEISWAHPRLLHNLCHLITEFQPNVVQVNGGRAVKYGAFARHLQRNSAWVLIYRNIGHPRDWVHGWQSRFFYRYLVMPRLNGVVGVSQTTLQVVKDFYSLAVPMAYIPRGVDPAGLMPAKPRAMIRCETQTPAEAPVIVYVGSLTPEKRPDRLLRVAQRVLGSMPELYLWLVGDGPLRPELEKQVKTQNLNGRVRFLGVQENVATYINAADLLLLTSDTEGIPGVILEAGLLGVPVVATRVGGVSECVLDGETGLLADPNDEEGFAQVVSMLLQDPARRQKMGRHAQTWIQTNFVIDQIAQKYLDFYREVLAR